MKKAIVIVSMIVIVLFGIYIGIGWVLMQKPIAVPSMFVKYCEENLQYYADEDWLLNHQFVKQDEQYITDAGGIDCSISIVANPSVLDAEFEKAAISCSATQYGSCTASEEITEMPVTKAETVLLWPLMKYDSKTFVYECRYNGKTALQVCVWADSGFDPKEDGDTVWTMMNTQYNYFKWAN